MQSPWNRAFLTPEKLHFNKQMSASGQCVEWAFEDIIRLWSMLDFRRSQKLFSSKLDTQYRVATILTNIYVCLRGCQTSKYFGLDPMPIEEYLRFGPKPEYEDHTFSVQ